MSGRLPDLRVGWACVTEFWIAAAALADGGSGSGE